MLYIISRSIKPYTPTVGEYVFYKKSLVRVHRIYDTHSVVKIQGTYKSVSNKDITSRHKQPIYKKIIHTIQREAHRSKTVMVKIFKL